MRGVSILVGLLAAAAFLLVASLTAGNAGLAGFLLIAAGVIAAWPVVILGWMMMMGIRFARSRERLAMRLEQETARCGRGSERVVLAFLRFPEPKVIEFPIFASTRGALQALRGHFRTYDLVERVGFDTYLAILPGADDIDVVAVRERLLEAVRREHRWRIRVGMSIHPQDGLTPEILINHAERHCA